MNTFADWLSSGARATDSRIQALLAFAKAKGQKWTDAGDEKDALVRLITDSHSHDPEQARALKEGLEWAWTVWKEETNVPAKEEGKESQPRHKFSWEGVARFFTNIFESPAPIVALGLAVYFLIIIVTVFGPNSLTQLKDASTARGSITFLFSLGTIVIALILVMSALFSNAPPTERTERFNHGKEVLTILIGILGTIVGFYFGTEKGETEQPQFTVSQAEITDTAPQPGGNVGVATHVVGGQPPYSYTVDFPEGVSIEDQTGTKSSDGLILHRVSIPDQIERGKEVSFEVIVRDATGTLKRASGKFVTAIAAGVPGP